MKNDDTMKWCSYHKEYHKKSEFGRNVTNKDALHNWCKKAMGEYIAKRYRDDPAFRERRKARALDYYRRNRDKRVEYGRAKRRYFKEINTRGE